MKKIYLCTILLLLVACESRQNDVKVYAINMLYACECAKYRVFRIESDKENMSLKDRNDIDLDNKKDILLENEISHALFMTNSKDNSISSHDRDSLIGWDLDLEFENKNLEERFYKDGGNTPICNIYYLEGRLQKSFLGEMTLKVRDYKILSKSPKCATN